MHLSVVVIPPFVLAAVAAAAVFKSLHVEASSQEWQTRPNFPAKLATGVPAGVHAVIVWEAPVLVICVAASVGVQVVAAHERTTFWMT